MYVDHATVDVFVGERPSTHPDHLAALGARAARGDLDAIVSRVPVLMFGLMGHDREPLAEVQRALAGAAEMHLAADQYGGHACTATPLGLSKWDGVVAYCLRAGLDPARVLAIGDGTNDRELLARAAVAVAPVDGNEHVVRDADHVVGSARDGGWAEILDLI